MLLRISLERSGIGVEVHLGVGTHIDGALQRGLEILDVEAKLVLVGSASRLVQVLMKLSHLVFLRGQLLPLKHLASTYDLH